MTEATSQGPEVNGEGTLDPRLNVFRPDLADRRLEGQVEAKRFVDGAPGQIIRPAVPLRRRPLMAAGLDTEALLGERLTIFDEADGWAWVQLARDRYVGYVPAAAVTREIVEPTHHVKALGTFLYPVADMKSPPIMHLSINAELTIVDSAGDFWRTHQGGFVISRHVAERTKFARDFAAVAEQLIGTPYLWGGKTRIGLDCSGLVQLSMQASGRECPRDTDLQRAHVGDAIPVPKDLDGFERGDLIFWPGHVGIMLDGLMLLHANAHHMSTVVETIPEAAERIAKTGAEIIAVRRTSATASAGERPRQTSIQAS